VPTGRTRRQKGQKGAGCRLLVVDDLRVFLWMEGGKGRLTRRRSAVALSVRAGVVVSAPLSEMLLRARVVEDAHGAAGRRHPPRAGWA
jgi:hypothetical protein